MGHPAATKPAPILARGRSQTGAGSGRCGPTRFGRRLINTIARIPSPVPRTSRSSETASNSSSPNGRNKVAPNIAHTRDRFSTPSRYVQAAIISIGTLLTETTMCAERASITNGSSKLQSKPIPQNRATQELLSICNRKVEDLLGNLLARFHEAIESSLFDAAKQATDITEQNAFFGALKIINTKKDAARTSFCRRVG